jgi:aminoglycoside phosphotransferase (APT) family kinase protein
MLGMPIDEVVRLAGSVGNRDYRLTTSSESAVIMKLGPPDELAREAWTLDRLASMSLSVPTVLAYAAECDSLGGPALILTLVEGASDEDPAVSAAAGAMMRRVHDVRLPGYGPLVSGDGAWRGEHTSWADAMAASVSAVPELVAAGILAPDLAQEAVGFATGSLVAYEGDGRLLHRDLKQAHLFGIAGALTGVIDWGDATVGDPLLDIARMSMASSLIGSFLDGYGPLESTGLDATLAAYRISWNLDALGYEFRAGGDWFDAYRIRVIADVSWLSSATTAVHH